MLGRATFTIVASSSTTDSLRISTPRIAHRAGCPPTPLPRVAIAAHTSPHRWRVLHHEKSGGVELAGPLLAHHEHRPRGVPQYAVRGAAQQQLAQPPAAVRAD